MAGASATPVGSRLWESWLKGFKAFVALTETRYVKRVEESQERPEDTGLARRADLLGRELVFSMARTDHFEKTGEVLPHPSEAKRDEGSACDRAVRYTANPSSSDERRFAAIYLCPVCKATEASAGRFARADVMPGSKHFGVRIPCPKCCPQEHGAYVMAHGAAPNMTPELAGIR
jgi:hypothetical protein